jgi:cystathionine gamma-lyase
MRFATSAIHAGQDADPATGATIVPIYQTSTFTQQAVGVHKGYEYSRSGNPTRAALETCLAALDGGAHGLAYASGLAAETGVLSLLAPGDHVVAGSDLYGGTARLLRTVFGPLGIETTFVDGAGAEAYRAAVHPNTRLVWVETPSNPLLHVTGIREIADVAHEAGALLAVDNTFATPALQLPLALGADIVVYSTTKYVGGHSDVVGGAVVLRDDALAERLRYHQNATGSIAGPFGAWLTLRGVKTLQVRMERHTANAVTIAERLTRVPEVEHVYYPGLPDHPGHDLAARQMSGFGGMLSVRLAGGTDAALRFLEALRVFSLAESLGGVESLACYPARMTHASIPEEERERRGIAGGLVRLSVGIEDVEDLFDDIMQALGAATRG